MLIMTLLVMMFNTQALTERIPVHQRLRTLDKLPEHRGLTHNNARIKSIQVIEDIYSEQTKVVNYLHNSYGFRVYPELKPQRQDQHIILAGCSFTYGNGLNNTETFPFHLGNEIKNSEVINMGLPGTATREQIFLWEHYHFSNLIQAKSGTMIYTVFNDHLNRANNNWSYLEWAPSNTPVYRFVNSRWVLIGEIQESMSYKWMKLLKAMNLSTPWLKLTSFFDLMNRKKHIRVFVSQIAHLRKLYLKQFPEGKFAVSEMAPVMALTRPEDREYFREMIAKEGISFWENNTVDPSNGATEYLIKGDGHPNAKLNRLYASFLINKINKLPSTSINKEAQ